MDSTKKSTDLNRDPITGEPGSHPIGTALGAGGGSAGAAAAGAMLGAAAGPGGAIIGAVAGAIVGGIAGGLAGSAIGEYVDPTAEDTYWKGNYKTRPYVKQDSSYDSYRPAYRYGYDSYAQTPDKSFGEAESGLQQGWSKARNESDLDWNDARGAVEDAYTRTGSEYRRLSGQSDPSGTGSNTASSSGEFKKTGSY